MTNEFMADIRRTFTCRDIKCFNILYKSLLKLHPNYGVMTWFPYEAKDTETVEKVQK